MSERKNEYYLLVHIYGIQKNGTDEPSSRAGIEMQTCLCLDTAREGESWVN